MEYEVVLRVLLFFLLLLMSGFFSGSETALFSLSPLNLMKLEEQGHPRVELIKELLAQPRRLIATIFIGNEFVNIAASALMASTTKRVLEQHSEWLIMLISTAISVMLILFLGEITPKNLAVRMVERWSSVAARPLWLLALVMAPLRFLIEKIADLVVYLIGKRVSSSSTVMVGEDEFLTMVDAVKAEGDLDDDEHKLIHNIFQFGDRRVAEVMSPATRVFALNYNLPLPRMLQEVKQNIFSRVPVYQGSRDRIVGVLYAKDLLAIDFKLSAPQPRLKDLIHSAYFVPKTTKCEQLFREFRRRRIHQAMVVDEYGHFIGLVTMEDLLEELFGEIVDEKELPSLTGEHRVVDPPEPPGDTAS